MQDSSITGSGDDQLTSLAVLRTAKLPAMALTPSPFQAAINQVHIDTGANDDVLKVDGGTGITYVTGDGSDQLQLYFTSLAEAGQASLG